MNSGGNRPADKRCAIYTRKSTSAGLEQDYNSLDAQRDVCESYIRSRAHEGWRVLPDRYDDGNFTGANLDRPALQQLLADVEAGRVDVIVTYKVDRVSRSLLDFLKLMERFEKLGISFASVTQHFSTADAMGRLTLNILLSFAEFEREMIAERTRDKIAASKRHGKWTGGNVPFGYSVVDKKLVVNDLEALIVRELISLYLEHDSAVRVSNLLNERGHATGLAPASSRRGRKSKPWMKNDVLRILKNPIYAGYIACGDALYLGQHEAIIQKSVYDEVQRKFEEKRFEKRRSTRNPNYLVRGLLRCAHCNAQYTPASTRKKSGEYRYYRCITRDKQGRSACPGNAISAEVIESVVLEQIRKTIKSGRIENDVYLSTRELIDKELGSLAEERRGTLKMIGHLLSERKQLDDIPNPRSANQEARIQYLNEEVGKLESRIATIDRRRKSLEQCDLEAKWVSEVIQDFDGIWAVMTPFNRYRLIHALVKDVKIDVPGGDYEIEMKKIGNVV